jgi:hypothetical protein
MRGIDAGVRINTVLIPAKLTGTGTIFSSPHDCLGNIIAINGWS